MSKACVMAGDLEGCHCEPDPHADSGWLSRRPPARVRGERLGVGHAAASRQTVGAVAPFYQFAFLGTVLGGIARWWVHTLVVWR